MTRDYSSETDSVSSQALSIAYHALRASRRRKVVQVLSQADDDQRSVRQIARQVTALENDIPVEHASGEPYRNVYTSLCQTHLPTLTDADLIIYDSNRKTVEIGPNFQIALLLITLNKAAYEILSQDGSLEEGDFLG